METKIVIKRTDTDGSVSVQLDSYVRGSGVCVDTIPEICIAFADGIEAYADRIGMKPIQVTSLILAAMKLIDTKEADKLFDLEVEETADEQEHEQKPREEPVKEEQKYTASEIGKMFMEFLKQFYGKE